MFTQLKSVASYATMQRGDVHILANPVDTFNSTGQQMAGSLLLWVPVVVALAFLFRGSFRKAFFTLGTAYVIALPFYGMAGLVGLFFAFINTFFGTHITVGA